MPKLSYSQFLDKVHQSHQNTIKYCIIIQKNTHNTIHLTTKKFCIEKKNIA